MFLFSMTLRVMWLRVYLIYIFVIVSSKFTLSTDVIKDENFIIITIFKVSYALERGQSMWYAGRKRQ